MIRTGLDELAKQQLVTSIQRQSGFTATDMLLYYN